MAPLLLFVVLARAGGGASTEVGRIDHLCDAKELSGEEAKLRVFAETSGAVMPKPRQGDWKELASETELRTMSEGPKPPNTEAVVKTARGGTLVSMYFQDSTSTWAHVVDYCFRPTGSLARVRGTFNSYTAAASGPGIRRRRTTYFDTEGAVLTTRTTLADIETDKPRPGATYLDEEDPVYRHLRALPFSTSLAPAMPADPDSNGVKAAVRERLPALKACYDKALRATPKLAGKVVARWSIDGEGKVTEFVWESDQMGSKVFADCGRRVIEAWRFAAPRDGTPFVVSFPFVFGGSDGDVSIERSLSLNEPAR